MNLSALDKVLSDFSESEAKYQTGRLFTGWNQLEKVNVGGRLVYKIDTSNNDYDDLERHNHLAMNRNISIKRNSRFNPVPEHVHSHIEINYVYSGICPQTIDGESVVLKKNQVLLIDTGCPHSIEAMGKDDIMVSVSVRKDFLKDNVFSQFSQESILSRFFINAINEKNDHDHYILFHSENSRRIPMFFNELFCECFDPSINSNDILIHLFYLIMVELINVHENDINNSSSNHSITYISPMIRYIESHFQTCTQESVADFFHISPNYVSVLLKKHIGLTYIQLIQEKKLTVASSLLKNTSYSVKDIANEAGYENISFFYKKFHKKYGCSPKDYRNS